MYKRLIAVIVSICLLFSSVYIYGDYQNTPSDWANAYVLFAKEMGLAQGSYEYGSYITREAFSTLIVDTIEVVLGESLKKGEAPFTDAQGDYIEKAYYNGIVTGKSEHLFDPLSSITREEMMVMMVRGARYIGEKNGTEILNNRNNQLTNYQDTTEVSSWAYDALVLAEANDLMTGTGYMRISPKAYTTVEEAIILISRLYILADSAKDGYYLYGENFVRKGNWWQLDGGNMIERTEVSNVRMAETGLILKENGHLFVNYKEMDLAISDYDQEEWYQLSVSMVKYAIRLKGTASIAYIDYSGHVYVMDLLDQSIVNVAIEAKGSKISYGKDKLLILQDNGIVSVYDLKKQTLKEMDLPLVDAISAHEGIYRALCNKTLYEWSYVSDNQFEISSTSIDEAYEITLFDDYMPGDDIGMDIEAADDREKLLILTKDGQLRLSQSSLDYKASISTNVISLEENYFINEDQELVRINVSREEDGYHYAGTSILYTTPVALHVGSAVIEETGLMLDRIYGTYEEIGMINNVNTIVKAVKAGERYFLLDSGGKVWTLFNASMMTQALINGPQTLTLYADNVVDLEAGYIIKNDGYAYAFYPRDISKAPIQVNDTAFQDIGTTYGLDVSGNVWYLGDSNTYFTESGFEAYRIFIEGQSLEAVKLYDLQNSSNSYYSAMIKTIEGTYELLIHDPVFKVAEIKPFIVEDMKYVTAKNDLLIVQTMSNHIYGWRSGQPIDDLEILGPDYQGWYTIMAP